MIERDRIVLPDPDSPTMPSDWPRSRENVTPSTARTMPRGRAEVGLEIGDLEQRDIVRLTLGGLDRTRSQRSLSDVEAAGDRSPMTLNDSTVKKNMSAGKIVAHHACSIRWRFSLTSRPHVGEGSCTL